MHEQCYIKVNARIDRGIGKLVSLLKDFPELETIESCEGDEQRCPYICFKYGDYHKHPYCELVDFVLGKMAPYLNEVVGDDVSIMIQAKPSGNILGELSVRQGATSRVEVALENLLREFNVCRRHNSEYCDGKSGTLP